MERMNKISIFGGKGFIGSNFAKLFPEKSEVLPRSALCSAGGKDALYFISTSSNYNVFDNLHLDIETNLTHLMNVLPNVEGTFNFISSWFVYGNGYDRAEMAATEKSPCDPKGFYSITKRAAEQLTISYCDTFSKNYRIMRLCNVIGGDPSSDAKKNAFEFLIGKILKDEDINIYDGDNFRNYLHVNDVCRAINLVTEKGDMNTVYNIGSTESVRIYDVMSYVIAKTGSKSKINLIATPRFHQTVQAPDFFMDCSKLRGLGFVQQHNIERAVDLMILHLKNKSNTERLEEIFRNPKGRLLISKD